MRKSGLKYLLSVFLYARMYVMFMMTIHVDRVWIGDSIY
jgi:hypothetical protein